MSDSERPMLRLTVLTVILATLLLALFARLWFLQVLAGERFAALAEENQIRVLVLNAPRGRILGLDDEVLVKNRVAQTISAHPRELVTTSGIAVDAEADRVLDRLSALLDMSREDIIGRLLSRRYSPLRAVPIKEDVAAEVVYAVGERAELFRGVVAETLPVRTYPNGNQAAHLVGYLGEISGSELDLSRYDGYRPGDLIGWFGLERSYESELRGVEGIRQLEVNANGIVLDVLQEREPVRGNDLVTSIDVELQADVERILEDGILASRFYKRRDGRPIPSVGGAAVVLDPRDGSVRAMASWPTFDPAEFVGGVSQTYWDWLNDSANQYPLLNRAIQAAYPPGSTFKIVSGAAGLVAGQITGSSRIECPPAWRLGNITFRNWNSAHEGSLDLASALRRSCDTFFYELAARQWRVEQNQYNAGDAVDEVLSRVAETFGLGRLTGVDLPGERSGVLPGREWRRSYWERTRDATCAQAETVTDDAYRRAILDDLCVSGGNWRGGDAVNTSIGQGDVLTTPLQIATAYAGIANNGQVMVPRVVQEVRAPDGSLVRISPPELLASLPLSPAEIAIIKHGLEGVVMGPRGTAVTPFLGFPLGDIPVAGKTGTAELKPKIPFAWFAAYAPANDPQYVVVVAVEQGGGGSQTAAPIARRILEAVFDLDEKPFVLGPRTD